MNKFIFFMCSLFMIQSSYAEKNHDRVYLITRSFDDISGIRINSILCLDNSGDSRCFDSSADNKGPRFIIEKNVVCPDSTRDTPFCYDSTSDSGGVENVPKKFLNSLIEYLLDKTKALQLQLRVMQQEDLDQEISGKENACNNNNSSRGIWKDIMDYWRSDDELQDREGSSTQQ